MAKKQNKFKGYDIYTQAVHMGTDYDEGTGAVRRPLHMANSYKLPDDLSKVNYSSTDFLMYSRNGNPNQHWLEEKGIVQKEYGGASFVSSEMERNLDLRKNREDEKKEIARYVANRLMEQHSILIDAGSTCQSCCEYINLLLKKRYIY